MTVVQPALLVAAYPLEFAILRDTRARSVKCNADAAVIMDHGQQTLFEAAIHDF